MTHKGLHLLAAAAMMTSGLLLGLAYVSHPEHVSTGVIASSGWFAIHALFMVSLILGLLGTTGFYARFATATGVPGLVGYLLLFVGMMLIAGLDYYEMFIAPYLAIEFPTVIEAYGAGDAMGPVAAAVPVSGALTVLGFALLGVATLRGSSEIGRGALIALIVSALIFGVGLSPLGGISVAQTGAGVFGLSLIWVGWCYWRCVDG